jgi:hypothetical protein
MCRYRMAVVGEGEVPRGTGNSAFEEGLGTTAHDAPGSTVRRSAGPGSVAQREQVRIVPIVRPNCDQAHAPISEAGPRGAISVNG